MHSKRWTCVLAVALLVVIAPLAAMAQEGGDSSSNVDFGLGFGGYSMVDNEPLTTTTVSFNLSQVLIGASFSFRTGESLTNILFGGKVLVKVRQFGATSVGVGGSLAFVTDANGSDTRTGLGIGGGVEHRLSSHFAVSADIYPVSLAFINSTTRVGILSSGALGMTFYF